MPLVAQVGLLALASALALALGSAPGLGLAGQLRRRFVSRSVATSSWSVPSGVTMVNTDACTNQCACGVGLTGDHCELNRFVVLTPAGVTDDSIALDVNANGSVVTGVQANNMFVWTAAAGSVVPNFGLRISSSAGRAINADGSVVSVRSAPSLTRRAARRTAS